MTTPTFAIVELMGHVRFGARVEEVEFCGTKMLRCEVLTEPPFARMVTSQSLYGVTFCTEEQARKACNAWTAPNELRGLPATVEAAEDSDDEDPSPLGNPCCECGAEPGQDCAPTCSVGARHAGEG